MEVLVLDGKKYVKASKAARDLGYASDYVGQLCRSGQVDSHLIGRTWYVNQEELGTHRFEKKRMSRVKARAQAKKSIEEHRLKVTTSNVLNNYKDIDIRYESDSEELIPAARKLQVQSSGSQETVDEPDYDRSTTILNKGEKIRMSGNLDVVDVTDGPIETDTFVLRPGRIRSGTINVSPRQPEHEMESDEDATTRSVEVKAQSGKIEFRDRLTALGTELGESAYASEDVPLEDSVGILKKKEIQNNIVGPYIFALVVVTLLVLFTLPLTKIILYTPGGSLPTISYEFFFDKFVNIISQKF